MTQNQLIKWAASIISRHLFDKTYGSISFRFEGGKITLVETKTTEKPSVDIQD